MGVQAKLGDLAEAKAAISAAVRILRIMGAPPEKRGAGKFAPASRGEA
jgi:hypothetical protein